MNIIAVLIIITIGYLAMSFQPLVGNQGNDSFTKLLLHARGTNGSTTIVDSSSSAHVFTPNGSAQIDTSKKHFPNAGSIKLAATGDYFTTPDHADFQFGTGDFTIDLLAWVAAFDQNPNGGNPFLWSQTSSGNVKGWFFGPSPQGLGQGFILTTFDGVLGNPGRITGYYTSNALPSAGVWAHYALVRSSGTFLLFLNGTVITPNVRVNLGSATIPLSGSPLYIGGQAYGTNGWLQEVRVSKGIARWTSSFKLWPRPYG